MRRRKSGGFTLLELIVVLIIIGISSALVVPRFLGGMESLDVRAASGKVAASLRYARSQAVSQRVPYTAIFNLEQDRLTIISSRVDEAEKGDATDEGEAAGRPGGRYDLPEGIFFKRVEAGDAYSKGGEDNEESFRIVFYPSGSSDGGEIAVANNRGRRYIVSIDVITGSVELTRGGDE